MLPDCKFSFYFAPKKLNGVIPSQIVYVRMQLNVTGNKRQNIEVQILSIIHFEK